MAGLGVLSVTLVANTEQFRGKMGDAKKQMGNFTGSIGVAKNALLGLTTAFLGLRGVKAGFDSIKGGFERLESVTRAANRFGIAVENLQVLREAAKRSSVEVRVLDTGIRTMLGGLGEAQGHVGLVADALADMGVSIGRLTKQTALQNFVELLERVANVADSSKRIELAEAFFGGRGTTLLDMVEKGTLGFDKLKKSMDAAGQLITQDQGDNIKTATNSIREVIARGEALADDLAQSAAPFVPKPMNAIQTAQDQFRGRGVGAARSIARIAGGFGDLSESASLQVEAGFSKKLAELFRTPITQGGNPFSEAFNSLANQLMSQAQAERFIELQRLQLEAIRSMQPGAQ